MVSSWLFTSCCFSRRISAYCIFLIFGIPELLDCINDCVVKKIMSFAVIVGVLAMFVYAMIADGYKIMPYSSILFGK